MLVTIIVTLIPLFIGIAISWPMIKRMSKMQKAREGKRTQFIIDTSDKGYPCYQEKIEKWLEDTGFGKYKARKNGRYLKYYVNGNVFKFGLNYHQQESKLILDAWLCVCGKESPLTFVSYQAEEGSTPIALDQYGKEQYLKTLNTLITVPEIVCEINEVTLQNKIEVSNFKSVQKAEKTSSMKVIWAIIIAAFILSIFIHFLGR